MSFAYLPLYTGDYLRDTRHLTPLKHGVYLLLLMQCWDQKGPLPLDEQECAGIANCRSADEIDALRYILRRFFTQMEDGWYNKRMQEILVEAEIKSRARSESGRLGGMMKARNSLRSKRQANAKQLPSKSIASVGNPSLNPNPILKPTTSEALASTPAPQGVSAAASPLVISIPLNDKSEYPVTASMVAEWEGLYPQCDVTQTLREIRGWNLANPEKRKTRTGVLKHINTWLAKEQNRG